MKFFYFIILIFALLISCKQKIKTKIDSAQERTIITKQQNNNLDCIVYSDSINIKKLIQFIKNELSTKSIEDFEKLYDLKKVYEKDKIGILNSKPELYFEKTDDSKCLNSTVYFNYNFSKEGNWKGEHQTIMKLEKLNGNFIIKYINHL